MRILCKSWIVPFVALSVADGPAFAAEKSIYDLDLGTPPAFATATLAQRACVPDEVVWIDAEKGLYYHAGNAEFAQKQPGAFVCKIAAIEAKYWDQNPFADIRDRGRSFPINPDLICPACS